MWDRILSLLKDKQVTEEVKPVIPEVLEEPSIPEQIDVAPVKMPGKSVHIGYNYLKGMDGDYEDSSKHVRRFINLNKLLRGDYNGKIQSDSEHTEKSFKDIRGEDSE
jgi:hypothetical protein